MQNIPSVLFSSIKLLQKGYGRNPVVYQIKAVGECLFCDLIYCNYMIITSILSSIELTFPIYTAVCISVTSIIRH